MLLSAGVLSSAGVEGCSLLPVLSSAGVEGCSGAGSSVAGVEGVSVAGASVAGVEGWSAVGVSAAKATPAEAAIRPSAAVAANRDEVVYFIVSPGTIVVRDECVTLTDAGRVASRRSHPPYNTS